MELNQVGYNNYIVNLKNKIYKLLPLREENMDWQKHLETLILEIKGLNSLLGESALFISLLAKLQALLIEQTDFTTYRKTVFECLSTLESLNRYGR